MNGKTYNMLSSLGESYWKDAEKSMILAFQGIGIHALLRLCFDQSWLNDACEKVANLPEPERSEELTDVLKLAFQRKTMSIVRELP